MPRPPPISTRSDTLFPSPPLFRSGGPSCGHVAHDRRGPRARLRKRGVFASPRWSPPRSQPTAKACQESRPAAIRTVRDRSHGAARPRTSADGCARRDARVRQARSEEHTSELQSLMRISYAVFCWKKKKNITKTHKKILHTTQTTYT